MKSKILKTLLYSMLTVGAVHAQQYEYEPNSQYPYGRLNPKADSKVGDFQELIGKHDCKSIARIDQNTWADTLNMEWTFKYIMNGMAVQDETLKEDGIHSGSIRQYSTDSATWYVHYYAANSFAQTLSSWEGNREDNKIVLYRDSPAPNGTPGDYRLTFTIYSESKFDWTGEWVNKSETFTYPSWKIHCNRRE